MDKQFGRHGIRTEVRVNYRECYGDPDAWQDHRIDLSVDMDALLEQLAARACRSKAGRSTGMHGAIVCKRVK